MEWSIEASPQTWTFASVALKKMVNFIPTDENDQRERCIDGSSPSLWEKSVLV